MIASFSTEQISQLRDAYGRIKRADPQNLLHFHSIFTECTDAGLKQLAGARISFVSKLALNECIRRGMRASDITIAA